MSPFFLFALFMENPWKTKNIKLVYQNPWISLEEHEVINPSGNDGIYGKFRFKNYALGIIPLDQELNTWLVGQYRYATGEYSWEIPMGGGINQEDILLNAKRELKEETGLTAKYWTEIMRIHTSNSVTDEVEYVFLAQNLIAGATEFEETEVIQIQKLSLKEAIQKVMMGEITDSISIAGLLKAGKLLNL